MSTPLTHRSRLNDGRQVVSANGDVVYEVPMSRSRVHPGRFVFVSHPEKAVCKGKIVFSAEC